MKEIIGIIQKETLYNIIVAMQTVGTVAMKGGNYEIEIGDREIFVTCADLKEVIYIYDKKCNVIDKIDTRLI